MAPETIPAEAFLAGHPEPIRAIADRLRELVRTVLPDAVEAVRPGWRLIGYDVPVGRRWRYAVYIAPEPAHVHLGFEHGILMDDPGGRLEGAGIARQVRWLTFRPDESIDPTELEPLIRDAARVAALSRTERVARRLDLDAGPGRP